MFWFEESTTYQAIVRKGRLAEARRFLILLGQEKLGPPPEAAMAAVYDLEDIDHLEKLGKRLLSADSWEALLDLPSRRRRKARRGTNT
ncbi:MAG TPA: hypothetical protein VH643_25815 [Gemmataceae bacterium]